LSEDFENDNVELYNYDELEFQSVKTLKEKFSECKKFINGLKGKFVSENIMENNTNFTEQHISSIGTMSKDRLPFEDYELKKMFDLMIEDEMYKNKTDYFYIIMIALFTGMRVEEICKLNIEDIKEENKINYFLVRGKVKTKTSVRKVPIHKILLEKFNFLDFVESKKDNERLFDLKPLKLSHKIKYSHYFLRDFGKFRDRFVSEERIETDLVSFHSFRHSTATRLNEKGIPFLETASLLGHKIDKKLMTVGYTQPSLRKNNKNLQRMYLNDIKYDLEKLEKKFKGIS
jgi:integrase